MSTEKERAVRGAVAATTVTGVVACLVGGYVLERLGYISVPGKDNSSVTKSPTTELTPTPDFTPTIPFTATPTRTLAPTLTSTSTSTSTSTPESKERALIERILSEGEGIISDYPAFLNVLGVESSGVSQVTVDRFKDYFLQRALIVESGNTSIQRLDRMFGQLSLPVKDLSDQGLNFDWRNNGQGLGFDVADLDVLRTFEQMKQVQESSGNGTSSPISRLDVDGKYRALTITEARDFEKVVLAYVDEHLRINGTTNPTTNPSVQDERKALFEKIVYGDWGVQATDKDGLWQTVDDNFRICETYTANAQTRSKQSEALRGVEFNPDQETGNGGKEGDTTYVHDSDNSVLVVMVDSPDYFRVEAYDLSDPPDPLNPGLDTYLEEAGQTRADGGRWLPCGPNTQGVPGIQGAQGITVPKNTPIPSPELPTAVPTNPQRNEPNPQETDIPDRKTATPISYQFHEENNI